MGRRTPDAQAVTLVFLDPPFAGTEYILAGDQANPTIVIRYGQNASTFTRHHPGR